MYTGGSTLSPWSMVRPAKDVRGHLACRDGARVDGRNTRGRSGAGARSGVRGTPLVVAIVTALFAAAALTATVAYVIRPSGDVGEAETPDAVVGAAPVV